MLLQDAVNGEGPHTEKKAGCVRVNFPSVEFPVSPGTPQGLMGQCSDIDQHNGFTRKHHP